MIDEFQTKFKEKALAVLSGWLTTNNNDVKCFCIDSELIESLITLLDRKYKAVWHNLFKVLYLLSNEKKTQDKLKIIKPLSKLNEIIEIEEDVYIQEMIISLLCELSFDDEFAVEIRSKCLPEIAKIFINNISKINKGIKQKYVKP